MSYDITITGATCPTCGAVGASGSWDPTYNFRQMFDAAFGDGYWADHLNGKRCGDVIPLLERVVTDMRSRPDYYRQFDASNGWGRYDGDGNGSIVDVVLQPMLDVCRQSPEGRIKIT